MVTDRSESEGSEFRHYEDHPDNSSLVIGLSDEEDSEDDEGESNDEAGTDVDRNDVEDMAYYEKAIQEIARGDAYTCLICTVEMDHTCKMYACEKCFRVYDYDCIREWAVKSTSKRADRVWKCPNCFYTKKQIPKANRATCWCGKTVNPEPNELNPNSCGQTCNAKICPHGCSKICHLGPHPDCTRMLTIDCHCGKSQELITCFQRKNYKKGYSCTTVCDKLLPCGIHRCKKKCHSDFCGPCPEKIKSKDIKKKLLCYCGKTEKKEMICKDLKFPKSGAYSKDAKGQKWVGVFSCKKIRTVSYSCNKHTFLEKCVAPPSIPGKRICEFSPKVLKTCPCGKSALEELSEPRKKCTDPIPTCGQVCQKMLKCGKHKCPFECHTGECMDPCTIIEKRKCSCEQRTFLTPCGFKEDPNCNIKCESLMSCRRHRCLERCCTGRPNAEKRRKATSFGSRDLADESLVEAEHICLKECNLMLTCGIHKCKRKCHPGKCPPCIESDSNDLVCPCGKTVIEAPVRCGTKLPPCPHPCIKVVRGETECGHKPMPHDCHPLDIPCPDCTETVYKPCKCGKEEKVRTVCFMKDVSCGKICGNELSKCHHKCQKKCHLPGECQTICKQICRRPRNYCNHTCPKPCHGFSECPDLPCTALVKIDCPCGRIEKEVVCGANSKTPCASETKNIACDDECAVLKRTMQLKEAFGIVDKPVNSHDEELERLKTVINTATSFSELELPFTEPVITTYIRHQAWCGDIETTLNKLIDDENRSSLHFKPMRPPQRYFIRELAKAYNLYSESQDRDPNRSVFVKKQLDNSSSKPPITIADAVPIYESFKQLQKDKKQASFEAHATTKLINITPDLTPEPLSMAKYNGFLIKNVSDFATVEDFQNQLNQYMKPTLIVNPQYKLDKEKKEAIIYPENYQSISVNVERDMETLVGHFDVILKENFLADSIELCRVDDKLG